MKVIVSYFIICFLATGFLFSQDKVSLSEKQKMDYLIHSIETLTDAKFIRNGSEYSAKEAAAHLKFKLGKAGDKITTAKDFIIYIASKSSRSGKPYYIKYSDGTLITSGEFLIMKLKEIDGK